MQRRSRPLRSPVRRPRRQNCSASARCFSALRPWCARRSERLAPAAIRPTRLGVCPYNRDIMLIKRAPDIRSSEITDKQLYLNRREFIRASSGALVGAAAAGVLGADAVVEAATPAPHGRKLENVQRSKFSTEERPNKWEEITTYNNYY